jgi:hypothetical protein
MSKQVSLVGIRDLLYMNNYMQSYHVNNVRFRQISDRTWLPRTGLRISILSLLGEHIQVLLLLNYIKRENVQQSYIYCAPPFENGISCDKSVRIRYHARYHACMAFSLTLICVLQARVGFLRFCNKST